jgi:hypothetical protein
VFLELRDPLIGPLDSRRGLAGFRESLPVLDAGAVVVLGSDADLAVEGIDLYFDDPRLRHLRSLGRRGNRGRCGYEERHRQEQREVCPASITQFILSL